MNVVSFRVDRALSREYGNSKGIGFMIDLTADKTKVVGVGGEDGRSSGAVSSPVAATKLIIHG